MPSQEPDRHSWSWSAARLARERLEQAGIPIGTECDEPAQPNVALIGTLVRNSDSGRAGAYQSAKGCEDRRAGRKLICAESVAFKGRE